MLAETSALLGNQSPRIQCLPPSGVNHPDVDAAVELVAAAGIVLDPWQEHVLRNSLLGRGEKWAAMRVGVVCPRQNGKNAVIEARILAGLFLFGERLIVYSAHLSETADEMFRRLEDIIEAVPWLASQVKHYWRANGKASIELHTGQRVKFRTRTISGGRGLSGDVVFFDEAMVFPESSHASVFPIISARRNPQVWYTGSAVDQTVHDHGRVLTAVREGALSGDADSLAYFEWSGDLDDPTELTGEMALDPERLAQANPAFGRRITLEYLRQEQEAFRYDLRSLAVERHGIGDWPALDGDSGVISVETWNALLDASSEATDRLVFGFDVSPNRSSAAISVAAKRADGLMHVGVVEHARGTGWVVPYLSELAAEKPLAFVCDSASPAFSLVPELAEAGIEVQPLTSTEHGQAYGMFVDACVQRTLRHRGTPELTLAVRGAKERKLGEAAAWARRTSVSDITPLVAATLALWQSATAETYKEPWIAWR